MQEFGIQLMGKVLAVKEEMQSEKGQGMVEYALILGLVSVACIVALGLISGSIQHVFTVITTELTGVTG